MLLQNSAISSTKATMGSTIVKITTMMMTIMVAVTTAIPQVTLAQRDVALDEPDSWTLQQHNNTLQEQWNNNQWSQNITILPSHQLTIAPTQHGVAAGMMSNKLDPNTVWSYAKGGGRWSILCSTIARINLSNLTGLPYRGGGFAQGSIARGDAYALALNGVARGQMIVTTKHTMESDIWSQYNQTNNTIFDVYFYKGSNGGVMQGHRAVVFIGTDDQVYILDTIRGLRGTRPQLLSSHFAADGYRGYTMYIAKTSYQPKQQYKTIQEYYEIQDSVSLMRLIQDDVAVIYDGNMLDDDVMLTITHPVKMNPDTAQEVVIEAWATITVKNAKTIMWWDLVYKPLPNSGSLEAVFARPILGGLIGPLDM